MRNIRKENFRILQLSGRLWRRNVGLEWKKLDAEREDLDHERRDKEWIELNNAIEATPGQAPTLSLRGLCGMGKTCLPKSAGEANIINISTWNKAGIAKTCWDLAHKADKL